MSKMTTEQFLSHLGIEVGKEFKIGLITYQFSDGILWRLDITNSWSRVPNELSWLLDKEITPLPKYTLSDAEKLWCRVTSETTIRRNDAGIIVGSAGNMIFNDSSLFPFLKNNEEIQLDELKKCL